MIAIRRASRPSLHAFPETSSPEKTDGNYLASLRLSLLCFFTSGFPDCIFIKRVRVMKPLSEIQSILHAQADVLQERFGLTNMAIFGSVVRGEAHEDSDVDILTDICRPISLLTLVEAEYYISDLLGIKADLVPARSVRPELKKQIYSEAVPV
jgi:predicted nucleotidyltransferase